MNFNASQQNISWFRDRYLEGTLVIKPPYQRNPVWQARQKHFLIESVLKNLPIPEIYIQQILPIDATSKTQFAIVDGQQRTRTVLQFIGVDEDESEDEWNGFPLDSLDIQSEWRNVSFSDLTDAARRNFFGYQFAVRFLDTESDAEIRSMFERLNRYQTPLNGQELRNARYTGPFATLANELADHEYWAENRIVSPALIRRMIDVEFVSELLIGLMHGPQSGSALVIDRYYETYEQYSEEFPDQQIYKRRFETTLQTIKTIFPDIRSYRWHNKGDFYSLFVAISQIQRVHKLPDDQIDHVHNALLSFAHDIDSRINDDSYQVSSAVLGYVNAITKGVTDKSRRAVRHDALIELIEPYFTNATNTARDKTLVSAA